MAVTQPDGKLASTYTHIYAFLVKKGHTKAAEALKKAVKDVVVLKDGVEAEGPSLDAILKEWKDLKEKAASNKSDSDSDTKSSSESSAESSSSDSDSDSSSSSSASSSKAKSKSKPKATSTKSSSVKSVSQKSANPAKTKSPPPSTSSKTLSSDHDEESDSDTDSDDNSSSDDDSSERGTAKPSVSNAKVEAAKTAKKPNTAESSSDSSDSSDSDADSSEDSSDSSDSDSESDDSSSESSSQESIKDKKKGKLIVKSVKADVAREEVSVTKKRKINEDGASVPSAVTVDVTQHSRSEHATPAPGGKQHKKDANSEGKKLRKANTPFQRVKANQVTFADPRLKDNRFESRGASTSDYGARASRDLIVTRGAGFRKEKNKKKRGSYRGGDITMQSYSIKFTD